MSDIYRDGSYIALNPSLHEEDSDYKFKYISSLLREIRFGTAPIRVLDIGGGAGVIAAKVCHELAGGRPGRVECHALDLSPEALALQRKNNPYCTLATSDSAEIEAVGSYDLALLIDVIEHIPDNAATASMVDRISRHAIYNIPTEINLVDLLRNAYMRGRYYPGQEASLGHVHFYSATGAKRFVRTHHRRLHRAIFPDFAAHSIESPAPNYVRQRANRLMLLELKISRLIAAYLRPLAPHIVQGSLFMRVECRGESRNG